MPQNIQILCVVIIYVIFLLSLGFYQGRKVKTDSDYTIANRSLPGWIAALSERAAGESSWALLGLPGFAFAMGLSGIWPSIGCVIGIIFAWSAIAWRLRDQAEKYKTNTFTDYIAKKHSLNEKWIRIVSSFTITFFFFFYTGAQFLGGGKVINQLFNIPNSAGIIITAAVVIPYTVYGGFRSVAYTDIIQSLIMLTTLVLGPIVGIIYIFYTSDHIFANTISQGLIQAGPKYTSLTRLASGFSAGIVIGGGLSWMFGYFGGLPQLSMRFMSIKNSNQAKTARNIGIVWTVLAYAGAMGIGWLGIAIFGPNGLSDPENVMPAVILKVFPPAIAGILIVGAVAAMLSTASSILLISSSELSENIFKKMFPSVVIDEKKNLAISRIMTVILAVIALFFTFSLSSKLIFTLVSYVWAGIGGTFSVVIMLSLFWKKYHGRAVIISIIYGLVFTIVWISSGMDSVITAKFMTFATTLLVAVLASYIIPAKK